MTQVQRVQCFVFHQHELQHLAFQTANVDTFQLQNNNPSLFVDQGLTHFKEALGVEKLAV